MYKGQWNFVVSLFAACLFLLLSSTSLTKQGLYYDELHQATASFKYVGNTTSQFVSLSYKNIPIMNMPFSGAIKSAFYGLYLKIFDQTFSVISWRLVSIIFVCAGLFLFGIIINNNLTILSLLSFYFFFITDISVLLTSRHDWGPTALALSMRLIILAVWLRGELSGNINRWQTCIILLIFGISLFEKLSSVVILIPIIIMIIANPRRSNKSHIIAALLGGIVGAIPLIFANLLSFSQSGEFISMMYDPDEKTISISSLVLFVKEYISMGAGEGVQSFILGVHHSPFSEIELILFPSIVLFIIYMIQKHRSETNHFRVIIILFLCYCVILSGLFILPKNTSVHHWIIGTPFQYAAIAVFVSGLNEKKIVIPNPFTRFFGIFLLIIFTIYRVICLASLEYSLFRGDSSIEWDKSLTEIGEFSARKMDTAYFLAADWGVANQMICFMNGDDRSVMQHSGNNGVDYVLDALNNSNKSELYIVIPYNQVVLTTKSKEIFLNDLEKLLLPAWGKIPVEEEIAHLRSVEVIRYKKISGS